MLGRRAWSLRRPSADLFELWNENKGYAFARLTGGGQAAQVVGHCQGSRVRGVRLPIRRNGFRRAF